MRRTGIVLMLLGFIGGPLWTACSLAIAVRSEMAKAAASGQLAGGASVSAHWALIGIMVGLVGLGLWLVSKRRRTGIAG